MFIEKSFIVAVEESFRMYKKHGARSTEKLKPIHRYIAGVMQSTIIVKGKAAGTPVATTQYKNI